MASSDRQLVTFRGGFIADFAVVDRDAETVHPFGCR